MKYIKKFEYKQTQKLKKYIIAIVNGGVFIIFETHGPNRSGSYGVKRLYFYMRGDSSDLEKHPYGYLREQDGYEFSFNPDKDDWDIIYESDNLNDCLDLEMLSTLYHANKYNL